MCAAAGIEPVDILLLLASSEGDTPKVVELLAAGANSNIKVSLACKSYKPHAPIAALQQYKTPKPASTP